MEKEFASVFEKNKDIPFDEYEINKFLERTIDINENEFPVIAVGNSDKETPKINGTITTKEYEEKENSVNINDYLEGKEGTEISNNAYSEEENKNYKNLQETLSLSENDIEVAGEIVDSEMDMSKLFPNSGNIDKEEEIKVEEEPENTSELTKEQSEIINNIYSKEENDIHKESEEESLEGYELSNIETVEDFNLDESFKKYDALEYNSESEDLISAESISNEESNAEDNNIGSDESDLDSLESNLKELSDDIKGDNKSIEDINIDDLIGADNLLNEDIKDETIRLGESDLNDLEDTLKDLPSDSNENPENNSSKDINIEDLIGLENIQNTEEDNDEEYLNDDASEEESGLNMKEYTDEELLDINNLLDKLNLMK